MGPEAVVKERVVVTEVCLTFIDGARALGGLTLQPRCLGSSCRTIKKWQSALFAWKLLLLLHSKGQVQDWCKNLSSISDHLRIMGLVPDYVVLQVCRRPSDTCSTTSGFSESSTTAGSCLSIVAFLSIPIRFPAASIERSSFEIDSAAMTS